MRGARIINLVGTAATALVLLIVIYTKVVQGAWLAILAMVLLFALMKSISRHYASIAREVDLAESEKPVLPARNHAVVLVSRLHLPTLRAVSYAKATRPHSLKAVTVQIDETETARLLNQWDRHGLDIPLVILESPYREITRPLLDYLRGLRRESPRDVVTVFVPEYVVGRWWEQLLHNQSALRLKARLLFEPGVMVTSVPWQLRSSTRLQQPSAPEPDSSGAEPAEQRGQPGAPPRQPRDGDRHDRAQRDERRVRVGGDERSRVAWRQTAQDAGMGHYLAKTCDGEGEEPQQHHRPEQCADAGGTPPLRAEQDTQDSRG